MPDRRMVYHWRHGWIPLTHAAALSKTHGSVAGAEKYVHGSSAFHGSMKTRGMSARQIHGSLEEHGHRNLGGLSDDDLTTLLTHAVRNGHDADMEHVLGELDRRDAAARATEKMAEARQRRKETRDAKRDARFDELVNGGTDPEIAYEQAYGVTVARQRQIAAIAALRQNGHRGAGFHELSRGAYLEELDRLYFAAEAATRGHLLSAEARRAGVDSRSLFRGNEATARRWASQELKQFWDDHGRLTLEDFRASLLGGSMKERTAGESWVA